MILDFYHNKIVCDTVSEGFVASFSENLVPKLTDRYGARLVGVQMYEDFLSDNLTAAGFAYYPLTVILDGGFELLWIRWSIGNSVDFERDIPYSYIGGGVLEFDILDTPPAQFAHVTDGRRMYFEGDVLPIHISTVVDSVKLSGKYSQTFLDEMAYAICAEIERAMAVCGIEKTGIRLEMPFAPETYMEHTSDNVTYRRILISDKTSSAKDLWVKWTRQNSAVGYSVCDHVSGADITFELGEDVSQKVREKEYRFLTRVSAAKYQAAMGRKNVTEWRELIKRALRRGELEKRELPVEDKVAAVQMNDELDRILEKIGYTGAQPQKAEPTAAAYDDELMRAIQIAEQTVMGGEQSAQPEDEILSFMPEGVSLEIEKIDSDEEVEPEDEVASEPEETEEAEEEPEEIEETEEETEDGEESEDDEDDLPWVEKKPALFAQTEEDELVSEDAISESSTEEKNILDELLKLDGEPADGEVEEVEEVEEDEETEDESEAQRLREMIAYENELTNKLKAEKAQLEAELRLKIEEEIERRKEAEAELARTQRECERLNTEFQRMSALADRALLEKEQQNELHRIEKEQLKAEIEARVRADERERARLAEAAMAEMEERRRNKEEAERAEAERRRLAEERERQLEEERITAEREAERARILRETAIAEAERAAARASENVNLTSYVVRLLFRHSVDPNSIAKIGELIKTTVAYYKKDELKIHVKASIPESTAVQLDFTNIPEDEHELIVNIIKVLGNSDLGIGKAILD